MMTKIFSLPSILRAMPWLALTLVLATARVHATEPLRLPEIFAIRYAEDHGVPIFEYGRLSAQGAFVVIEPVLIAGDVTVPDEYRDKYLLPFAIWYGYNALGPDALANFQFGAGVGIGLQVYYPVTPVDHPRLEAGALINISTRGTIDPNGAPLIGGFVIEGQPRRVLLRGVDPGLREYQVVSPLANPELFLFRNGDPTAFATNDDWDQQPDNAAIEAAAAEVGAFPLAHGETDAALLVELPPGLYTVLLGSVDGTGGTALVEVYGLP